MAKSKSIGTRLTRGAFFNVDLDFLEDMRQTDRLTRSNKRIDHGQVKIHKKMRVDNKNYETCH